MEGKAQILKMKCGINSKKMYRRINKKLFNSDYQLTRWKVCTGKYFPEVFVQTEWRSSEVCAEKTESKYFLAQTEQTMLMKNLLHGF